MRPLIFALALVAAPFGMAIAADRKATLAVDNMDCASCPAVVKAALSKVEGVGEVTVDYVSKTAMVRYDDRQATVQKLLTAAVNAGYPASVIQQ